MQGPAGNHRDRHENIGKGSIGVDGFRRIVNCPHFTDIPLILETPLDEKKGNQCYQEEITLLMSLIDDKWWDYNYKLCVHYLMQNIFKWLLSNTECSLVATWQL